MEPGKRKARNLRARTRISTDWEIKGLLIFLLDTSRKRISKETIIILLRTYLTGELRKVKKKLNVSKISIKRF